MSEAAATSAELPADAPEDAAAETQLGRFRYWSTLPFVIPIRIYQKTLARVMPPICRFEPSCSHYTLEAFRKRGVVRGAMLGTWRILRCNPFCKAGYDPVPERRPRA